MSVILPSIVEKTGTFTPVSGVTISEERTKQVGKFVEVHFYAEKSGGFGSSEFALGTISGVDLPPKHIRTLCGIGSAAYSATSSAYVILSSTTGQISVLPTSSTAPCVTVDIVYSVD